jgi:serine/threonine-protein kinase
MSGDPLPPVLADRYELRGLLGSGGMATVYRCWDRVLAVERAIKVLNHRATGSTNVRSRFLEEARTMARLRHPNVVRVHDMGVQDDRAFLVMDLLEGGTVSDRLREGRAYPVRHAVELTIHTLEGLAAAHAAGVVHRDIKPQNLLLDEHGQACLTDFGISRAATRVTDFTRTGAQLGTLTYMPPEQRDDPRKAGPASDLFAVGTTLYALLTARRPVDLYVRENLEARIGDVPPSLADVLRRACAYAPADRYASAEQMADALRAILPDMPDRALDRSASAPSPPAPSPTASTPGPPVSTPSLPASTARPAPPSPGLAPPPAPDLSPLAETQITAPPEAERPPWSWIALGAFTVAVGAAIAALALRGG